MNLVVIKNGQIVFTNYLRKANEIPLTVGWSDCLESGMGRLAIYLRHQALFLGQHCKYSKELGEQRMPPGPIAVFVSLEGSAEEISAGTYGNEADRRQILTNGNSFYCRSDERSGEIAAATGDQIYKDPVEIYRATFAAHGMQTGKFYCADIDRMAAGIKLMTDLDDEHAWLKSGRPLPPRMILDVDVKKYKTKKQKQARIEEIQNSYDKLIDAVPTLLGLTTYHK